jgi:hypothetical protein
MLRIDASSQLVDFEISDVDAGVRVGRALAQRTGRETGWTGTLPCL